MDDIAVLDEREAAADLAGLALRRIADLVGNPAEVTSTLDAAMLRLFDRDHRELLTYSAFGSSL
jgi:hypothetical protein